MRHVPHAGHRPGLVLLLALGALVALGTPGVAAAQVARGSEVAVLPFEVRSARDLAHLGTALADRLAARLESAPGLTVAEPDRAAAVLGGPVSEADLAALRAAARSLGAAWIVAPSVTELGGRFSVEARIVPADPSLAVDAWVATAASEEALLDRVDELAERVVAAVKRRAPAPRPESPPSPATAAPAAGPARAPAGEGAAAATGSPAGARPAAAPARRSGEPVVEVRVVGNRRIEADAIRARLATRPGEPYDPARVSRDVREIHALGFFRNVRATTERTPQGRVVVFEVEENPVVRQITISGNQKVDADRIRDELTLTTGATLDHPLLFENRERIEALYRAQGYYDARVTYSVEPLPNDAVAVHFEVNEGRKLRLREIDFEGNEHFTDDELRAGLRTRPWRFYSVVTRFIDRSGTYSEPVFLQDLQAVERKYLDAGFLQVEVGEPRVETTEDGLVVTVPIREGERYRVGTLDVAGDPTVDLDALRDALLLDEDEWFNRSHLTGDVERLTRRYTDRGFFEARVNPVTRLDPVSKTVDVTFEVEKGPLHFVRKIDITGNTRTVDPVIRREIQLVEGELYSARALAVSQGRIQRLGFFEEVQFEPRPTDEPEHVDVEVKVVERPTGSLSFGLGFSSQDRLVLSGSVSQSNLFGRGYGLQASVDTGGRSQRIFLSFSNPYVLGTDFGFSASIFSTDARFEDFEQSQQGADLALSHVLDEEGRTRGFLRYSFASREIDEDTGVNAASMIFRQILAGSQSTSLGAISFRSDTRNDRVLPTEGMQLAGSFEFAGLGGFSKFLRFEGRAAWHARVPERSWLPLPFGDRATVMLAGRMGWAVPFNDVSDWDFDFGGAPELEGCLADADNQVCGLSFIDTDLELPLTERYFLGGLGTFQLRGFRARSVGPRRAVLWRPSLGGALGVGGAFAPVGREGGTLVRLTTGDVIGPGECADFPDVAVPISLIPVNTQGDGDGVCNDIDDEGIDDFEDLDETDVIGGSKFLSLTAEYRFPISEQLGLVGIAFLDVGNAFAENESMLDVGNWRMGTGLGVLWFSPFGPLQAFWGVPLDALEVEDGSVFEFSVGGAGF